MGHYYRIRKCGGEVIAETQTKKDAIKLAKVKALEYKSSMEIERFSEKTRAVEYVGIAEFPYFLRSCQLDLRDITYVAI